MKWENTEKATIVKPSVHCIQPSCEVVLTLCRPIRLSSPPAQLAKHVYILIKQPSEHKHTHNVEKKNAQLTFYI